MHNRWKTQCCIFAADSTVYTRWGIITGPPSFNWHYFVKCKVYLKCTLRLGTVIYWMCYGVSVKYLTNRPCFTELNWTGYGTQTAAQRLLYTWAYVKESWPERPFMFVCFLHLKTNALCNCNAIKCWIVSPVSPKTQWRQIWHPHLAAKGIATPLSCYMSRGRNCPHKSALSSIMLKMYKIQFGHGLLLGPSCRCKR